jgi:nitrite reductase/ring-hydroxylating ferredoxin subunit/DMSO/TMAO reductase YedYZ heme-binding membrane subunit
MSVKLVPVSWTPFKIWFDGVLLAAVALYLTAYTWLASGGLDDATVAIRARGSLAFILVTLALAIGPAARLDRRFLPLLYNRRHLGVITALVAASHALAVLDWYFVFSPTPPLLALLISEPGITQWPGTPFIPFGIAALAILAVLAATSHDFWLAFLGPPLWKAMHMALYAGYALVVAHIGFGQLQAATMPGLAVLVVVAAGGLIGLHLAAARRAAPWVATAAAEAPWLIVPGASDIVDGRAVIIRPPGAEAVAVFRDGNRLSAVSHLCAHQNGPLGEGRVLDGCVTCPWHGFQYRLEDGCAPAPFTEKIATYRLRRVGQEVWLDPRANPPGTYVEPLLA